MDEMKQQVQREVLKKLLARKLASDDQMEPKEGNDFLRSETLQERSPVTPEDIQKKEPMQLAQNAESSKWEKLKTFLTPAPFWPEPTSEPKEQLTEKLNKILSGKEREEQLRKQLELTK